MSRRIEQLGVDYYKLKVQDGGNIVFDVGATGGSVTVTGDLTVQGESTSIGSSDLVVEDNTITVNNNETGAGVSLLTAGLIIDRGSLSDANLLFDEQKTSIRQGGSVQGSFSLQNEAGQQFGLYASSIKTINDDDLYLLGYGTGLVKVTGTSNYEKNITTYDGANIDVDINNYDNLTAPTDDDVLINARYMLDYVRDYHKYNFQDRIALGELTPSSVRLYEYEEDVAQETRLEVTIDNEVAVTFKELDGTIYGVTINGNTIGAEGQSDSLILQGGDNADVKVNDALNLTTQAEPASNPASGTAVYGGATGDGGTGVYFKNEDGTTDELASRNKALLFSIIF